MGRVLKSESLKVGKLKVGVWESFEAKRGGAEARRGTRIGEDEEVGEEGRLKVL